MIEINGKEYEINMDIRWGTQKLLRRIQKDVKNPDNEKYMEYILKDILVPKPTMKELLEFRQSDIERVFNIFASEADKKDKDFKKKRSKL